MSLREEAGFDGEGEILINLPIYYSIGSDIPAEHKIFKKTIDKLNSESGHAKKAGLLITTEEWKNQVSPFIGQPVEVIINKLSLPPGAIFVGIIWSDFGLSEDNTSKSSLLTATVKSEFNLAYRYWKTNNKPRLLFFRCLRKIKDLSSDNEISLLAIKKFFSEIVALPQATNIYYEYFNPGDIDRILNRVLVEFLDDLPDELIETRKNVIEGYEPENEGVEIPPDVMDGIFGRLSELNPGEAHDMAFVSVDIADHSKLAKRYKSEKIQKLLTEFYSYSKEIAIDNSGEIFSWGGDGGVLAFWGLGYRSAAIKAGVDLITGLTSFNLNESKNPLNQPIFIRVASASGPVIFRLPLWTIASNELNFAVHLQENETLPGEFRAPEHLVRNAGKRFQDLFFSVGRYNGVPILCYKPAGIEDFFSIGNLKAVAKDIEKTRIQVKSVINSESLEADQRLNRLSVIIDDLYSPLDRMCRSPRKIYKEWPLQYLKILYPIITLILKHEKGIWEFLKDRYSKEQLKELQNDEYFDMDSLVEACASKRSRSVPFLEKLERIIFSRLHGDKDVYVDSSVASDISRMFDRLKASDELDEELILFEFLLNYKQKLIDFVLSESTEMIREIPLDRLWKLADLILQDDIYSYYTKDKLYIALSRPPCGDCRFRSLINLLSRDKIVDKNIVLSMVDDEMKLDEEEWDLIFRCLLIAHKDSSTKMFAAKNLSFLGTDPSLGAVGKMISRSRVPIDSLKHIGEQLIAEAPDEERRLFFYCTRARLEESIQNAQSSTDIENIDAIIGLFWEFDFIIEDLYFSRFEVIVTSFMQLLDGFGLSSTEIGEKYSLLKDARTKGRRSSGKLPEIKPDMPLWIQKKLAGELPYLIKFISHADPRIALETYRNIDLTNVEKVLRIKSINEMLCQKIVKRREFMTRPQAKVAAILNPKCGDEIAAKLIRTISINESGIKLLKYISHHAEKPNLVAMASERVRQSRHK